MVICYIADGVVEKTINTLLDLEKMLFLCMKLRHSLLLTKNQLRLKMLATLFGLLLTPSLLGLFLKLVVVTNLPELVKIFQIFDLLFSKHITPLLLSDINIAFLL